MARVFALEVASVACSETNHDMDDMTCELTIGILGFKTPWGSKPFLNPDP